MNSKVHTLEQIHAPNFVRETTRITGPKEFKSLYNLYIYKNKNKSVTIYIFIYVKKKNLIPPKNAQFFYHNYLYGKLNDGSI